MLLSSTNGINHSFSRWGCSLADKVHDQQRDVFVQDRGGWSLSLAWLVKDQVTVDGEV